MNAPQFTILRRDTEWDFPEINILARSIRGLVFRYDKAPGIVVIPGRYSRDEIIDALGYGTFEHEIVEGFESIPASLVQEAREAFREISGTV
jgi:hypothetical protein